MDQKSPKITPEQLVKLLMEKCPELGEKIITALNDAPDGHWISGSEEQVRDAGHAFVKAAFEAAVQQKVAAAEAAFLPSTGLPGQETRQSRSAEDPIFENPGIGSALVVDGGTPRPMAVWRVWMIT